MPQSHSSAPPPDIHQNVLPPYSEEVHEILSYIPNNLIMWGTTVVFISVFMLIALTWFIKYPDVVPGRVMLTTTNPPASIVARSNGALQLFTNDETDVTANEVIAVIQNPAKYNDILTLKRQLKDLKSLLYNQPNSNNNISYQFDETLSLGELQIHFNALVASLKRGKNSNNAAVQNKSRKQIIQQQIQEHEAIITKLGNQISLLESEYKTGKNILDNRYIPLYRSGALAKAEIERQENDLIQKLKAIENSKASINQNNHQVLSLKGQLNNIDFEQNDETINTQNEVVDALSNLDSQINIWEQRYLLKAPINGKLSYIQFSKNNMFVKNEQEVATILPKTNEQITGELYIPTMGSGKVDTGQVVNIAFDSYLKKEFGMVKGKVKSIAPVTTDATYRIEVSLSNGLQTTANKSLPFKHNMQGQAEIITEDLRLIERIFNELRMAFM